MLTLAVNHVGGAEGNPNDAWRMTVCFQDMWERVGEEWDDLEHNWIDLPERDFLFDHPAADATIVHFIPDIELGRCGRVGLFNISPAHSIPAWRQAILDTNSKYVYVWGNEDEVSGKKLGDLLGYRRLPVVKTYGIDLAIYEKE